MKTLDRLAEIQDANPNEIDGYVSGDPSFKFEDQQRMIGSWRNRRVLNFAMRAAALFECGRCGNSIPVGATIVFEEAPDEQGEWLRTHPGCWDAEALYYHRGTQPKAGPARPADPGIGRKAWYKQMGKALRVPSYIVEVEPVTHEEISALNDRRKYRTAAEANEHERLQAARHWIRQEQFLIGEEAA